MLFGGASLNFASVVFLMAPLAEAGTQVYRNPNLNFPDRNCIEVQLVVRDSITKEAISGATVVVSGMWSIRKGWFPLSVRITTASLQPSK